MTESGYHRHHASAIVIGSEPPDRLRILTRVKGVPGISLGCRDGIYMGIKDKGLPRRVEAAADRYKVAPVYAVRQTFLFEERAQQSKHSLFFKRRGGDAYHLPQQFYIFAVILHHCNDICVPPSPRRASEFLIMTSEAPF